LGDVHAGAVFLDHLDDLAKVPIGPLQALDDGFMGFALFAHDILLVLFILSPRRG
jgi:hypothetical protein